MAEPETTRLTITWSKETDLALRDLLAAQGRNEGDLSKFVEDAVRWRIFHETVDAARKAFAGVPEDELKKNIDDAVDVVRAKRYQERANRS
jgi:predicted nucleic acid-binding protein